MEKVISAADANRKFSQVLHDVKQGQSYVVTRHGRAVARIAPAAQERPAAGGARSALLSRLRSERAVKIGPWKRDELYE